MEELSSGRPDETPDTTMLLHSRLRARGSLCRLAAQTRETMRIVVVSDSPPPLELLPR